MKYRFVKVKDFINEILNASMETSYNFTIDSCVEDFWYGEPTGWYGIKKTTIFDIEVICMGYYGGEHLMVRDMCKHSFMQNVEELDDMFSCLDISLNDNVCVEIEE